MCLLIARWAQAQPVSFGVKGGVPLTGAVEGSFGGASEAGRYTVGPMLELRLPASFAFEANALYKRTGYRASQSDSGVAIMGQVRARSWEFPMLMKYYLASAPAAPRSHGRLYVGAGYVVRRLWKIDGTARIVR